MASRRDGHGSGVEAIPRAGRRGGGGCARADVCGELIIRDLGAGNCGLTGAKAGFGATKRSLAKWDHRGICEESDGTCGEYGMARGNKDSRP